MGDAHHTGSQWAAGSATALVAGRDFTAFLTTENAPQQLDLIKASPHKQGSSDASIQSGRECTLSFSGGGGQANMIQFVFREAYTLL